METKPLTVEEMNVFIADYAGWELVQIGWDGDEETETQWQRDNQEWLNKVRLFQVGRYWVKLDRDQFRPLDELSFHTDWNDLMPVVRQILNSPMDTFDSYALWLEDSLRTADIKKVHQAVWDYLESRPNNSHPSKVTGEWEIK